MRKILSMFLTLIILLTPSLSIFAFDIEKTDTVLKSVGNYLAETVKKPVVGSVGGEWTVLGLARSDMDIPDKYFENYYQSVKQFLKNSQGVLHNRKYTEYSRVILALTAIGKDPSDVAGYNLLKPLSDYEATVFQGINGAIWALIALDCGNYDIPVNKEAKVQATREKYISHILERQNKDGGWSLSGDTSDPDITAMSLTALSSYKSSKDVFYAIEKALLFISSVQNENGGFSSRGCENSESTAQVLTALCKLGIPLSDERFVKDGNTLLDNLISFYNNEEGFSHNLDGEVDLMATEQSFLGLVSYKRIIDGKSSIYEMNNVIKRSEPKTEGWAGKNPLVKVSEKLLHKTFPDITGHKNQKEIEELASRNIVNGQSENTFAPDKTMTRAEFSTILVKGLGLPFDEKNTFSDIKREDWFFKYVNTAYAFGIVRGISDKEFNPYGIVTREEACVMLVRCAKLCGMNTEITNFEARNILAQFTDYIKISSWAMENVAFIYDNHILSQNVTEVKPKENVTRAEVALMLYNTLFLSELI